MQQNFLDYEQPIAELEAKIDELRYMSSDSDDLNITEHSFIDGHIGWGRIFHQSCKPIFGQGEERFIVVVPRVPGRVMRRGW